MQLTGQPFRHAISSLVCSAGIRNTIFASNLVRSSVPPPPAHHGASPLLIARRGCSRRACDMDGCCIGAAISWAPRRHLRRQLPRHLRVGRRAAANEDQSRRKCEAWILWRERRPIWPSSRNRWPNQRQFWSISVEFGPLSAEFGPTLSNSGPSLVEIGTFRETLGRNRAGFGRVRASFGRVRASVSQSRAKFGRLRPTPGQLSSLPGQLLWNLAIVAPHLVETHQDLVDALSNCPNMFELLGRQAPIPPRFGRARPGCG